MFIISLKELKKIEAYIADNNPKPPVRIAKNPDAGLPHTILLIKTEEGEVKIGIKAYGKKEKDSALGEGAFGKTQIFRWLERNEEGHLGPTDDASAVKIVELESKKIAADIEREIEFSKAVYGEDQVHFYDKTERKHKADAPPKKYIIMPFFEGTTLCNYAATQAEKGGMDPNETKEIMRALVKKLQAMHNQDPPITHNDLKDDNVMYDPKTKELNIIDFGYAKHVGDEYVNQFDVGAILYTAPEMLIDKETKDLLQDLLSEQSALKRRLQGKHSFMTQAIDEFLDLDHDLPEETIEVLVELMDEWTEGRMISRGLLTKLEAQESAMNAVGEVHKTFPNFGSFLLRSNDEIDSLKSQLFTLEQSIHARNRNIAKTYPRPVTTATDKYALEVMFRKLCQGFEYEIWPFEGLAVEDPEERSKLEEILEKIDTLKLKIPEKPEVPVKSPARTIAPMEGYNDGGYNAEGYNDDVYNVDYNLDKSSMEPVEETPTMKDKILGRERKSIIDSAASDSAHDKIEMKDEIEAERASKRKKGRGILTKKDEKDKKDKQPAKEALKSNHLKNTGPQRD